MTFNPNIQPGDAAVITFLATTFTVADMNLWIGAITAISGLGIQLYFKIQQNRRENEKHGWDKKQNQKP